MSGDVRKPTYRRLHVESLEQRRLLTACPNVSVTGENGGFGFPECDVPSSEGQYAAVAIENYYPARWSFSNTDRHQTGPLRRDPAELVIDLLRERVAQTGLSSDDLDDYVVTDHYTSQHTGVAHVYLRQTLDGLEIADANTNANVTASGQLIGVTTSFIAGLHDGRQSVHGELYLEAPEALGRFAYAMGRPLDTEPVAVEHIPNDLARGMTLRAAALSPHDVPAELHYVPIPGGVELAWRFEILTVDGRHWYNASVSAENGQLLRLVDWVDQAQYQVFPLPLSGPTDGDRSIVVDPHDRVASPFGWHDTNGVKGFEFSDTRGNNVFAQEDRNADDAGGAPADGGATLDFDFPLYLDQPPAANRDAAITNAF